MSPLRIVFLCRRFWPLVGEAEDAVAELAIGLRDLGHQVTILTAVWNKQQPIQFRFEEVPVFRIGPRQDRPWSSWRHERAVARWLTQHRKELDIAVTSGLKHYPLNSIGALSDSLLPIVALSDHTEIGEKVRSGGPGLWPWRKAGVNAVVTPNQAVRQSLLANGWPAERLHVIAPGIPIAPRAGADARRAARRAIAAALGIARYNPLSPLVVCAGPLESSQELKGLIDSWKLVARQWPDARMWIFGEGSQRSEIYDRIEQNQQVGRILLPGVMENVDELHDIADVFVAPGQTPVASRNLLRAMAAGRAVVASDTAAHRDLITPNQNGLLYSLGELDDAATAIQRLLKQPSLAQVLGNHARQKITESYSLKLQAKTHADLYAQVIDAKCSAPA